MSRKPIKGALDPDLAQEVVAFTDPPISMLPLYGGFGTGIVVGLVLGLDALTMALVPVATLVASFFMPSFFAAYGMTTKFCKQRSDGQMYIGINHAGKLPLIRRLYHVAICSAGFFGGVTTFLVMKTG